MKIVQDRARGSGGFADAPMKTREERRAEYERHKLAKKLKIEKKAIRGSRPIHAPKSYHAYMHSRLWRHNRRLTLRRDRHKCHVCRGPATTAHHIQYPKRWVDDCPANLRSVREDCHLKIHGMWVDLELAEAEGHMRSIAQEH